MQCKSTEGFLIEQEIILNRLNYCVITTLVKNTRIYMIPQSGKSITSAQSRMLISHVDVIEIAETCNKHDLIYNNNIRFIKH